MPETNFSHEEFVKAVLFDLALNIRILVKTNQFGHSLSTEEILKTGSELQDSISAFIKSARNTAKDV